ncbi:hypothetical protein H0H93_016766 [Arthromyces matolae]|nr:hypothetical protein H0H93_016766 [Arthromyces matolae]
MLATQRMSPPNPLFTGNQAGAPLPLVPRRLSRESSSAVPIRVVIQQSSPPLAFDESGSSSSSGSDTSRPTASRRIKRASSEHTEPTSRRPLLYSPGVSLRLTTARNFSESHAPSSSSSLEPPSTSTLSTSQSQPRLIRKKSGQLVKSSLKPSKSLSLLTTRSPYIESKSAPATPTHAPKNVHFDAQLEHVKLFLAEQKPLAVSRDGSPTEDTASGTDTDFPDWVFGSNSSHPTRNLAMHHINMPPRLVVPGHTDVLLESLELSTDSPSVVGRVRVANLAYAKIVVARFTFDAWQTTSEVSARYVSSPSPRTDIFVFSVRLNDLMARIDGKRMCLAIRYSVGGRELWDNNYGQDYVVEFALESKSTESEREGKREFREERERDSERGRPESTAAIASLRSTLEKVVAPTPIRPVPRYDFSKSPSNRWNPPPLPHTPIHTPRTPQRTHLRTKSYPVPSQSNIIPGSATPKPASKPANTNLIPWPVGRSEKEKAMWTPPLGSPRDAWDEDRPPFMYGNGRDRDELEDLPFPVTGDHSNNTTPTPRNHRRGYFQIAEPSSLTLNTTSASGVRRTPPGSPPGGVLDAEDKDISHSESGSNEEKETDDETEEGEGDDTPMPGRCYSFPPSRPPGLGFFGNGSHNADRRLAASSRTGLLSVGELDISELSTPSLASSRDSSPSPSPSPSPTDSETPLTETEDTETEDVDDGGSAMSGTGSYTEFLSRFCFFTGTGTASGVGLFADSSSSPTRALPPHLTHTRDSSSSSSHLRSQTYPQKRFVVSRTDKAPAAHSTCIITLRYDAIRDFYFNDP